MSQARYDSIGRTYATTRRPDPRVAKAIDDALGDAVTVLNVGAGTGAYEPPERDVTALEPSAVMREQRAPDAAPCIAGVAEDLPFADDSFDAVMASLTLHHWPDWRRGARECVRVSRGRIVVLSWDPRVTDPFWLISDYFPFFAEREEEEFAPIAEQAAAFGADRIVPVPVPHDCTDGFAGAFWRRPAAYLQPQIRAGMSIFARRSAEELEPGLRALEDDLASGAWAERHADLLQLEELDLGYRLLIRS